MLGMGAFGGPGVSQIAKAAPVAAAGPKFDWRIALASLASLAPHLVESRNAQRAQDELMRGRLEAEAAQATADKRIGDEVAALETSTPEPDRAAAQADYTRAVRQARTQGDASMPSTTLGSTAFKTDQNASRAAGAAYGARAAGQFAAMDAPIRQRERETRGAARAGVDVKREGSRASSADFLARLRATNRGRVSPWATILGQLGQRIATNYQRPSERTIR